MRDTRQNIHPTQVIVELVSSTLHNQINNRIEAVSEETYVE